MWPAYGNRIGPQAVYRPVITHYDLARPTPVTEPFSRPGWIFELKYDGFRVLGITPRGEPCRLLTRSGNDIAKRFPEIVADLKQLPELVLDGELVTCDERGHPQFGPLSRRARLQRPDAIVAAARAEPACIFAFDLLELHGENVRPLPLLRRKAMLREVLIRSKRIRYLDHVETDGEGLFRAAEEFGLEGIVGKQADAPYRAGRTRTWVKVKTGAGREIVRQRARWNERR